MLAKPAACIARMRKSPDPSPVNTRPVRLAPCAAGARPSTRTRASGSPNPGTGRPQYVSFRCAAFFSCATRAQYVRSRAQRSHLTMSPAIAARRSEGIRRRGLTGGGERLHLLVRVVGRSHERSGLHVPEAELESNPFELGEFR